MATRTSLREVFYSNIDIRLLFNLIRFAVALLAVYVLQRQSTLLIAIPPLALSLHLTHRGRLRSRAERQAWQQLAESTDAFNAVQMDTVLRTAVQQGLGAVLGRPGRGRDLGWRHPPGHPRQRQGDLLLRRRPIARATTRPPPRSCRSWPTSDGSRIGELRLRFRAPVEAFRAGAVHASRLRRRAVHRDPQRRLVHPARRAGRTSTSTTPCTTR